MNNHNSKDKITRLADCETIQPAEHEIIQLAEQFETPQFLVGDPSFFMHQVNGEENQEAMAFIASCLSFGSRQQFMKKIQFLLDCSSGNPYEWICSGAFVRDIPADDNCFYRMYTNNMLRSTLQRLQQLLQDFGSMKAFLQRNLKTSEAMEALTLLVNYFSGSGGIVPKNTQSSCKRLCMFLRWMVRNESPVDLGIWSGIIDKRTLIMPMDTHVMQQSQRLGLISAKAASMSTAQKLSAKVRKIFPDDPLKADFALFGYGVSR